jgi:hypothetical protein
MAAEREGKLVSARLPPVEGIGWACQHGEVMLSRARNGLKRKKSALGIGVGSDTLGARAALIALKKGAYLRRGRTSRTVSIIMEDDGASFGLRICILSAHHPQASHCMQPFYARARKQSCEVKTRKKCNIRGWK